MGGILHRHQMMRQKQERTGAGSARRFFLAVAALLVPLVAVPGRASASDQVHFQATIAETETVMPGCSAVPSLCVTIVGSGRATNMGQITEHAFVIVNLAGNEQGQGCNSELRQTTFTAASGGTLTFDGSGVGCGTGATATARDTFWVVGGTGQFSGVHGHGSDSANIIVGKTASITFSGTLFAAGAVH